MNQRIAPSPRQWFASPVCIRPQPAIDPATGLVEQIWKSKTCARKKHAAKFLRKLTTANTSSWSSKNMRHEIPITCQS